MITEKDIGKNFIYNLLVQELKDELAEEFDRKCLLCLPGNENALRDATADFMLDSYMELCDLQDKDHLRPTEQHRMEFISDMFKGEEVAELIRNASLYSWEDFKEFACKETI